MSDRERRPRRGWRIPIAVILWLLPLALLHVLNSRLFLSWHGLLHSGIATRFPSPTLVPENPFFAGEPLPYYWFYHFVGATLGRLLAVPSLSAFRMLSFLSLAGLVVAAALAGRRVFRSTAAGLLVGYLALVGLNPLGPGVAAARLVLTGQPLVSRLDSESSVETVFVTNEEADEMMTQPLLGAMYLGWDWQYGMNLVWFLDVTGRAPALACVMGLAFFLLRRRGGWGTALGLFLAAALLTAFDPLMGLAVVGAVVGADLWLLFSARRRGERGTEGLLLRWGALGLGCVAAAPTYFQILLVSRGTGSLSTPRYMLYESAFMALNFLVLLPLALWGLGDRLARENRGLSLLGVAGIGLVAVVPFIHLKTGVEHDLSNAGQCFLALPAVLGVRRLAARGGRWARLPLALVLLFIPVTAGTLWSYTDRPAAPLHVEGDRLVREPPDHPVPRLYEWIREATPADAVLAVDPRRCLKMAGNVSEIPAFTGRALFVDRESYLVDSLRDFPARTALAIDLVEGRAGAESLPALSRPVYLLSYRGDDPVLSDRLARLHGEPVFREGFLAVYRLR